MLTAAFAVTAVWSFLMSAVAWANRPGGPVTATICYAGPIVTVWCAYLAGRCAGLWL